LRKIFLLLVLFFYPGVYSQKLNPNFFTDIYSIPSSDSTLQLFYFYKIPVHELIFSKTDNTYSAAIQLTIEVSDSNSNFIQRQFKDRSISFNDFSLTTDPSYYIEGVVAFPNKNKTINVTSRFFDVNSKKELSFKEQRVQKITSEGGEFLTPIVLSDDIFKCYENNVRVLTNWGGFIPFDDKMYDILIPCTDTTLEKLFIKVISGMDTVFNGPIERTELERINFAECNDRIIISYDSISTLTSNFYLTQLTKKLKEGQIEIIVSNSESFLNRKSYRPIVKWINKPRALAGSESAIKLLRFIIKNDSIKQILKSGDNYDTLLHRFWKNIDPSPATEYNELMAEYYERIDYSMKNFSTITGLSGLETNRAKIYILYGTPSLIERGTNGDGKISETWTYAKLHKIFIFVDEKGTGEFILKNTL